MCDKENIFGKIKRNCIPLYMYFLLFLNCIVYITETIVYE